MQTIELKTLGWTLQVQAPATYQEYNEAAKSRTEPDPCLADALNKTLYHRTAGAIRSDLADLIERETGIPRRTEERQLKSVDADGNPLTSSVYTETAAEYINRALREAGKTTQDFAEEAQSVANANPVDPSGTERSVRPRKLPAIYAKKAAEYEASGKLNAAADRLTAKLGREVEPTTDSVGWALKEFTEQQQREAEAALEATI